MDHNKREIFILFYFFGGGGIFNEMGIPNMEQWTGSKLGKEYVKAVHCHSAHLIYIPNISCEISRWMNSKLQSRLPGEIATTSDDADDTTLMAESEEKHGK